MSLDLTVNGGFTLPAMQQTLPDLSAYTPERVMALRPAAGEGRAALAPVEGERYLSEAFRRELGEEITRRQGRDQALFIAIEGGPITLGQLVEQLADPSLAKSDDGTVTLRLPILVREGAALVIDGAETPVVRLASDAGAFLANGGELFVSGAEVIGWNDQTNEPARYVDKNEFRPYLASYVRSKTHLVNSRFAHLGYAAPTAYGVSLSTQPERRHGEATEDSPTGVLVGNVFEDLYYGFYSYEARDVAIVDNLYRDSIVYGIDPHDRSTRLIIAGNTTTGTKERHGIIGSRGVSNSFIFNNDSHANAGSGVMLDRACRGNVVVDNRVHGNGQGIAIYESPDNLVLSNLVAYNAKSAVRIRNSTSITVQDNTLVGHGDFALEVSARQLSDHAKRVDRGDLYEAQVGARLYANRFGPNYGVVEATGLGVLRLAGLSFDVDAEAVAKRLGMERPEASDGTTGFKLGGDLKGRQDELAAALRDADVEIVVTPKKP